MKKYNNKLLQLAVMQGVNWIWIAQDAWLPPPLKKDGYYQLDMDQDIWLDHYPHFEELPPWLTNTSVKEGILLPKWLSTVDLRLLDVKLSILTFINEYQ